MEGLVVWALSDEFKINEVSYSKLVNVSKPEVIIGSISKRHGVPSEKLSRVSVEEIKPLATGKGNKAGSVVMIDGEYIVSSPEVFSRRTTTGVSFTDRRAWKPFGRENTVSSGCSGFRDKQRGSKFGDRLSL